MKDLKCQYEYLIAGKKVNKVIDPLDILKTTCMNTSTNFSVYKDPLCFKQPELEIENKSTEEEVTNVTTSTQLITTVQR